MRAVKKRQSRKNARNRSPAQRWRATAKRWWPLAGSMTVAIVAVAALFLSGAADRRWAETRQLFADATAQMGFSVERVYATGRFQTDRQTLIEALGVDIHQPIFEISLETARQRVEALPWVSEASVERRLPDTIILRIDERTPLALWQNDGRLAVVDDNGDVIDGAHPQDFRELLLVVGPDAADVAADLIAVMNLVPEVRDRVRAAVRIGNRRWNLKLDDGIDVQLPEDDLDGALYRLADLDSSEQLLARDVQAVDLRLPDKLVLRLTPEAQARMSVDPEEGEDT
ncbi:MAG: cell division protein FtsQ/DivIB [Pseudomonadota bacterium]